MNGHWSLSLICLLMNNAQLKAILEDVFPVEYMSVGEVKVDYLLAEEKILFTQDKSDSGVNMDGSEYIMLISSSILILKEGYSFVKMLRKDLRRKIKPEEVLKEMEENDLSDDDKKKLIQKVLKLVEEEND